MGEGKKSLSPQGGERCTRRGDSSFCGWKKEWTFKEAGWPSLARDEGGGCLNVNPRKARRGDFSMGWRKGSHVSLRGVRKEEEGKENYGEDQR